VFLGARHTWPPAWDPEWARRYPLLPVLAVALARGTDIAMAQAAQWTSMLVGSLVPAATYALGQRSVGRTAALAAACWMVFQDGLTTYHVFTSAYSLIPSLYLLLLLGLVMGREGGWVGRALAVLGAALLSLVILQGVVLVAVTTGAALLAFAPRCWRRPWRLLRDLWPPALGALLAQGVLLRFGLREETPLLGALRLILAEVNLTLMHNESFGPPTGHKVHRLLNGTPRLQHMLATVWEQLYLPAWLVLLGALLGIIWLLRRRDPASARGRGLLLLLLVGPLYGFVANSEDFHVYQWFPTLALVLCAGLCGWTDWLPLGRWRSPLRVLLAAGLLVFLFFQAPRLRDAQDGTLYSRVVIFAVGTAQWADLCDSLVAPVSARGSLVVDDPDVWAHRGLLLGRATLSDLHHHADGAGALPELPTPVLMVSNQPPSEVSRRLAGRWHYAPLLSWEAPKRLWLYRLEPAPTRVMP